MESFNESNSLQLWKGKEHFQFSIRKYLFNVKNKMYVFQDLF